MNCLKNSHWISVSFDTRAPPTKLATQQWTTKQNSKTVKETPPPKFASPLSHTPHIEKERSNERKRDRSANERVKENSRIQRVHVEYEGG